MTALDAALAGRPLDRPLRAPLFAALAADVEEVPLAQFLADPGRRARIYADLARTLRPDVLVVDSGSGWEADAAGVVRIADLLRRTRAVVGEPTLLAVTLTGPATAGGPLAGAVQHVLAAARAAAEAGAGVVFVDERVDAPPDGYARAVTPLWGALKFMRALGVLKAPWAGVLPRGPFLPCGAQALDRPHGLAVEPGAAVPPGHTAALVTHTEDLAGHVPIRDLRAALELLG